MQNKVCSLKSKRYILGSDKDSQQEGKLLRNLLILTELLNASDYLTLNFFVDKLSVSRRTVQNEIASLVKLGESYGFRIISVYGKGYLLEIQEGDLFKDFYNKLHEEDPFDKEVKKYELLAILLLNSSKYVSTASLSDKLLVSKTFINNQLQMIDGIIEDYGLEIERKSHYGIRINGDVKGIIDLLLQLYLSSNHVVVKKIKSVVTNFNIFEEQLMSFLKTNQMRMDYLELQSIINRLKIIILYHSYSNNKIKSEKPTVGQNFLEGRLFLHELEKHYAVAVDLEEKERVLAMMYKDYVITNDYSYILLTLRKDLIIFLKEIDKEEDTKFSLDSEFIERLYIHLKSLVERMNRKVLYENPMLVELSIKHPRTFNLVFKFSDFFSQTYGLDLSNDELSYIATHFLTHIEKEKFNKLYQYNKIGIVCATGGGVAYLIKMQIESLFPISEIKTFSMIDNEELEKFEPELIFTITPLLKKFKVPTILIKELLSDEDLIRIKEILLLEDFDEDYAKPIEGHHIISSLFHRSLFHSKLEVETYEQALEKMAHDLHRQGYAASDFKQNVFLREEHMATIFNNGIAIPHPIESNAKKSAISLAIVNPVIKEKSKEVRLIFMICLRKDDYPIYSKISETLYYLMNDPQKVNDIENMVFFEEIINALVDIRS